MNFIQNTINMSVDIDDVSVETLINGALDEQRVNGLTHNFYRYPARFSPVFARSVIETFTKPGDFVFDPFMGGGTTLVEATAAGRFAAGTDISSLAAFVSKVKTTPLTDTDLEALSGWSDALGDYLNIHAEVRSRAAFDYDYYQRNLNSKDTWRLRKLIEQAIDSTSKLYFIRRQEFARCVILRTAQWALDGRKKIPTVSEFRSKLSQMADEMINASRVFSRLTHCHFECHHDTAFVDCHHMAANELDRESVEARFGKPKLVLTSPPYPGVHVLYHRWQVDGRKETPAPFWIANKLDGAGASFYTMGDRKQPDLVTYFASIESSFAALRHLLTPSSIVVQMVAFSNPDWQLGEYLDAMNRAGYFEQKIPQLSSFGDGRLWRDVPNRKWYAQQKGSTSGSREVVLFHRMIEDQPSGVSIKQPRRSTPLQNLR